MVSIWYSLVINPLVPPYLAYIMSNDSINIIINKMCIRDRISTDQIRALGVDYVIIGHNERVERYHENKSIVNMKLIAALEANILPILCFGENIDDDYKEVIPKILDAYLKDVLNIDFITFAYEPAYAIGTGTLPSVDRIKEVTDFISKYIEDKYHKKPSIIYGCLLYTSRCV